MFGLSVPVVAGLLVLAILFAMAGFATLLRKVGPHEALIVYGIRGPRTVTNGGTILIPMLEQCRELSLELMSFDVAPQQSLYSNQGVAVTVEAVAQLKVKSDPVSIRTAAEQFLTKRPEQREGLIRLVMEGHLRGIIGQLTVEQIVKEPEMVGDRMRTTCASDMNKMGLAVISFTIKEVRDKNEYITNIGRPDVARIKRDADVATAEADRDTAIRRAQASREAAIAKATADQERVLAETLSLAKQAEAQRDLEIKQATYLQTVKNQQAQAEISFKKGEAEAKAMNIKAEAYQEYNQAAVVDKLISSFPEIVRAMSAPLSQIDKITIVSTGDGNAAGAHKITGDMAQMAAQ